MIINDLLQSLGRPKMCLTEIQWSSMISYKSSVSQICVIFRFNDRQWSPTKPRSPKYVSFLDSMISYKDAVAQICVLIRLNDRQWSLTMSRSPKCVFCLFSMIVNDLFKSLGRSYIFFVFYDRQWSLTKPWSLKFFFYDLQWSVTKPRSPKYIFYSFSMIVIVLFISLGRQYIFFSTIVNDLLQSLGRPNMCFICFQWLSIINKASVAHTCFLFVLYDRQWSLTKTWSRKYVSYLDSMIVNDLLRTLSRPNMRLI